MASRLKKALDPTILNTTTIRTASANYSGLIYNPEMDYYTELVENYQQKQWNSMLESFREYQGFDFPQGALLDRTPIVSNLTISSNTTAKHNIWLPYRSRIRIDIAATSITNTTKLHYQISENNMREKTIEELKGTTNTLLICPELEGIKDNSPITVTIWRTEHSASGAETYYSNKMVLYLHTYGEPEIHITHPKKRKGDYVDSNGNYVINATEIINRTETDNFDDCVAISPVLALMVSQDALDDSGIESFTRVHISEYLGYNYESSAWDDFTGYNGGEGMNINDHKGKLYNTQIINKEDAAHCTGQWTGVFRDSDGATLMISGVADVDGSGNRIMWSPFGGSLDDLKTNERLADHRYGKDENGNPCPDLRFCFRAGYKYLIVVRRFHGYAAGFDNLDNKGIPQYGYLKQSGGDYNPYPPYTRSGYEVKVTNQNGNRIYDCFPGPSLDSFDVSKNNAFTLYNMQGNETTSSDWDGWDPSTLKRWVGPYAGDIHETESEALYPGFSQSDYVITDCVKSQTSTKNLINVRPASQEISADHWITFGYRHLARSNRGCDTSWTRPKVTDGPRDNSGALTYNNDGSVKYFNRDGVLVDEGSTPYWETVTDKYYHIADKTEKSLNLLSAGGSPIPYVFNHTWELTDTTNRRIGKMLLALVSKSLREFVKCSAYQTFVNNIWENSGYEECDDYHSKTNSKGETTYFSCGATAYGEGRSSAAIPTFTQISSAADIKPHIKVEMQRINYWSKALVWETVYEADNFPTYTATPDSDVNQAVFDGKNTFGMLGWYLAQTDNSGHKPAWVQTAGNLNDYSRSANDWVIYNEQAGGGFAQYGNEYTWVPIINAQNGANWLPVSVNAESSVYNPNRIVSDAEFTSNTDNVFTGHYLEEGATTWGGCEYKKFLNVDYSHTFKIEGTNDVNPATSGTYDGSASPPATYPVIWENHIPTADDAANPNRSINNRHFSITNGGTNGKGGRQYFSYSKSVADQTQPGRLYLRVPPTQDCENGSNASYNPREIPNRQDHATPTARTTHLGFLKTHISGDLRITVSYEYKQGSLEVEDDSCNEIVSESITTATATTPLASIGSWGADVGFSSGPIYLANGYNSDGSPNGFTLVSSSMKHVLTVFGEDNNGLGRCLSANDYTSIYHYYDSSSTKSKYYYINEAEPTKTNKAGNGGGIEIPIRVRYTPLAQPELTDYMYSTPTRTSKNSNVIKILACHQSCSNHSIVHKEYNSTDVDSGMKYKDRFSIDIAYGLFNDKSRGYYVTQPNTKWYNKQHMLLMGAPGDAVPSTDYYPAVGICNAFMVVLFPHEATNSSRKKLEYFGQPANFWANRGNFETIYSYNGARPVIVADVASTDIYRTFSTGSSSNNRINNQLSTAFKCDFVYTDLIAGNKVISKLSSKSTRNSSCKLEQNVWYDLVVVPIYTNDSNVDSTRTYKDGAGNINGKAFGGGSSNAKTVYYYGSNPLVIRNFLNIASIDSAKYPIDDEGNRVYCRPPSGGGSIPTYSIIEPPFSTEGCILYPNVNHFKFNPEDGNIKDCPGFWLNNTFRVVIRAPHFRTRAQINADSRYGGNKYNYEQNLETASNGQIENPEDFEFSDVMIHFGKYTEYVKVRDPETGEWVYDEDEDFQRMRFDSATFQDLVRRNALNKEWLNARNIYTIRNNPEAWSKRVPEVFDDANNIRETIKAGSLTSSGSRYKDRMVIFNPNMVGAYTYEPEGYYMQVCFLNAQYAGTSQQGTWSAWCGGIMNDDANYDLSQEAHLAGQTATRSWKKDESLEYYVPVRSYSDIYTTFRHYISGSTPGSYLTTPNNSKKFTANYTKVYQDADDTVKGAGGHSPLHEELPNSFNLRNQKDEASFITHKSVISDKHYTVPEYEQIISTQPVGTGESTYQPWPADYDYTEYFGYLRDPNINPIDFEPSHEAVNRYAAFHEMYYLDYIIRNMAKLYHSNWSEQCCTKEDMNAKDIGWTLAKEFITGYTKWSSEVSDDTSAYRKSKADKDRAVTDKFFKQSIKVEDFDNLLIVLKKLVDFTRNTKWSGIHTSKTDTTNSQGEHTGLTVLPIDSSRLSLNKCTDEDVGGGRRMLIDADINKPNEAPDTSVNPAWRALEGNYIDRLWKMLTELVIQDSDPDLAQ